MYTVTQRIPGCDSEKTSNKYQPPKGCRQSWNILVFRRLFFARRDTIFQIKQFFVSQSLHSQVRGCLSSPHPRVWTPGTLPSVLRRKGSTCGVSRRSRRDTRLVAFAVGERGEVRNLVEGTRLPTVWNSPETIPARTSRLSAPSCDIRVHSARAECRTTCR